MCVYSPMVGYLTAEHSERCTAIPMDSEPVYVGRL